MTDGPVRRGVIIALLAGTVMSLATVLYVLAFQPRLFPDLLPDGKFTITVSAYGASAEAALDALSKPAQDASDFLRRNGYSGTAIGSTAPQVTLPPHDNPSARPWLAEQSFNLAAPSYSLQARLANRLEAYAGKRTDMRWEYPDVPFASLAIAVGVITLIVLSLSVAVLERRQADVSASPRGLNPVMVFIQTMNAGCLLLCSITAAHLLSFMTARVLTLILAIGVFSLAAWLYKTNSWWKQTAFLRSAYAGYVALLLVIVISGAIAARVSPT